jgi:hypothetical protein
MNMPISSRLREGYCWRTPINALPGSNREILGGKELWLTSQ